MHFVPILMQKGSKHFFGSIFMPLETWVLLPSRLGCPAGETIMSNDIKGEQNVNIHSA